MKFSLEDWPFLGHNTMEPRTKLTPNIISSCDEVTLYEHASVHGSDGRSDSRFVGR